MHIASTHEPAYRSRFARETEPPVPMGAEARYALEGAARPGDVLTLAGGGLMRDANENGLVDGYDERVESTAAPAPRGAIVDVRV